MTLYQLLNTLDCRTSLIVVNFDTKERTEFSNKNYMDDVEEKLGKWYGVHVNYIQVQDRNRLYVELSDRKSVEL